MTFLWFILGAGVSLLVFLVPGIRFARRMKSRTTSQQRRIIALESRIAERGRPASAPEPGQDDYRELFLRSHDGLVLTGSDGAVLDANPAAAALFGTPLGDFDKIPVAEWPADPAGRDSFREMLSAGATVRDHALRIRTADGRLRACRLSAHPRMNGDNVFTGYRIILRDAEGRAPIGETPPLEADPFRLLVENMEDVLFLLDMDLTYVFVSPSVRALRGFDPEELIGRPMRHSLAPGSMLAVSQLAKDEREALESDAPGTPRARTITVEMRRKQGPNVWTEVKAALVRDRQGNPIGVAGAARDISGQKQAEDALKNAYHRLNQILEFLPDPTFVIDSRGLVTAWNRAVEELTGINAASIIGKGNYEHSLAFYRERRPALADIALNWDDHFADQYLSIKRRDDGVLVSEAHHPLLNDGVYVAATARVLQDAQGRPVGAIESLRNITEVKLAEKALQESERRWAQMIEFLPDAHHGHR